ncbi:hypothetical protein BD626DRAFT_539156 [Schizophyllum amplum]|uniref:Uncharacterized protein n=1 Tax=Schizophyllum amplum TaxID=97359 RepID=A0A550C4H3_9AGAR|nr:hypothetical protein BD626DRAFT_539156 [Auriculariopsis ampla]
MWREEERVLRDERGAWFSPLRGARGVAAMGQRGGPVWQGYGAVGTSSPSQRPPPPAFDEQHDAKDPNRRFVDFDADKADTGDRGDVKLHWTRMQRGGAHQSTSQRASPSQQHRPRPPALRTQSSVGSSRSTPKHGTPRDSPKPPTSSPLPPDAVDLVVEKDEDRRGLQRVYRRGFVNERGEEAGEVEVDDPGWADPSARVEVGEEVREAVEEGQENGPEEDAVQVSRRGSPRLMSPPEEQTEPIARTTSPPALVVDPYAGRDEDNPWL